MGDNFQFWLYVIIAVIYVISRAMKKSNRQRQEQAPPRPGRAEADSGEQEESLPPMSFEELLREITEGKKRQQAQPAPPPTPAKTAPTLRPRPKFVDYDDDIEPEGKSLERAGYDRERQETTRQVYERAQREAALKSSLGGLQSDIHGRKSSLETLQSSLSDSESTRFESFRIEDKHTLVTEYIKELRTPSGMKKAVVLSEILKPKF